MSFVLVNSYEEANIETNINLNTSYAINTYYLVTYIPQFVMRTPRMQTNGWETSVSPTPIIYFQSSKITKDNAQMMAVETGIKGELLLIR